MSRAQRSLDVRLHLQATGHRFPGQQSGGDHHRRIAGIGARGDRRNQHITIAKINAGPFARVALGQRLGRPGEAVIRFRRAEQGIEFARHIGQRDAVLRALRAGQGGNDAGEVEAYAARVVDLASTGNAEQSLGTKIGFEELTVGFAMAGGAQVADGLLVNREETHRRTVLGRHIGQCRAVGDGQGTGTLTEILDEGTDHFLAAQQLGHGQHQIGRRDPFPQAPDQFDADHIRSQKIDRLPEHRRFGLDATDAPADDADGIDHRRVRVGTDQCVRKTQAAACSFLAANAGEEMFEVDLVHNAHAGRYDTEGVESLHAPLHELIALVIALELPAHVLLQRLRGAVVVNLHRMIDDQIDRYQGLDAARIVAAGLCCVAHRRQIAEQRHAGEILQHHTRDDKGNLLAAWCAWLPLRELADIPLRDPMAIAVAQQRFQHDAQGHRQAGNVADLGRGQRRQRVEQRLRLSRRREAGQRIERRMRHGRPPQGCARDTRNNRANVGPTSGSRQLRNRARFHRWTSCQLGRRGLVAGVAGVASAMAAAGAVQVGDSLIITANPTPFPFQGKGTPPDTVPATAARQCLRIRQALYTILAYQLRDASFERSFPSPQGDPNGRKNDSDDHR